MILASMVFIWLGLATLHTLALCRAAKRPDAKTQPLLTGARVA